MPIPRILRVIPLLVMVAAGCMTPHRETLVRYALEPPVQQVTGEPCGGSLAYRPLSPARPYGVRMMTRSAGLEMRQSALAEWADLPSEVVTRALADTLTASGLFTDVGEAKDLPGADYLMTGDLRAFYCDTTVTPNEAVCEMRIEVRRLDRSLVWADTLIERAPMETTGYPAFAAAMSVVVGRITNRGAASIAASLP